MHRMEVREKLTNGYLIAAIALFTAFAASAGQGKPLPMAVFFVSPVFALIMAVQISGQVKTIQKLASFLRFELNEFLIRNNAWAPHWDWHTRYKDRQGGFEETIDRWKSLDRALSQFAALHVPSFLSVTLFTYRFTAAVHSKAGKLEEGFLIFFLLILSWVVFFAAMFVSWLSYKARNDQRDDELATPNEYLQLKI